jgi:hypothetical protein
MLPHRLRACAHALPHLITTSNHQIGPGDAFRQSRAWYVSAAYQLLGRRRSFFTIAFTLPCPGPGNRSLPLRYSGPSRRVTWHLYPIPICSVRVASHSKSTLPQIELWRLSLQEGHGFWFDTASAPDWILLARAGELLTWVMIARHPLLFLDMLHSSNPHRLWKLQNRPLHHRYSHASMRRGVTHVSTLTLSKGRTSQAHQPLAHSKLLYAIAHLVEVLMMYCSTARCPLPSCDRTHALTISIAFTDLTNIWIGDALNTGAELA